MAGVHGVVVRRPGLREIALVCFDAFAIRLRCLLIATYPLHDVCGHVLQVPRRRHHALQPLGCGYCHFRVR